MQIIPKEEMVNATGTQLEPSDWVVRFLVKIGVSMEIEGEETPALVAEWLHLLVTS